MAFRVQHCPRSCVGFTLHILALDWYNVRFFNAVHLESWKFQEYEVRLKIRNWIYCCKIWLFLDEFAKVRKATISFVMSVRHSVSLSVQMEQLGSHWTYFHDIWHLRIFRKCVEKTEISLTSDKNNGYCTWRPIYTCLIISRSVLRRIKSVSDKIIEKIKHTFHVQELFF